MNEKNNIYCNSKEYWRAKFGTILRTLFDIYGESDETFSEYSERVLNHSITDSAVRKWFVGQRLPHKSSLHIIMLFFLIFNLTQ